MPKQNTERIQTNIDPLPYAARISKIWPNNPGFDTKYLDIVNNHKSIAARLDITSGVLQSGQMHPIDVEWDFEPSKTSPPVKQKLLQEFKVPITLPDQKSVTVKLTEYDPDPQHPESYALTLTPDSHGEVNVWIGNSPLDEIMLLEDAESLGDLQDHHFELYYRMFNGKTNKTPIPTRKKGLGVPVGGGSGDCVPLLVE